MGIPTSYQQRGAAKKKEFCDLKQGAACIENMILV